MHKPAQVELQLDRPQLPYSETLGPTTAGGSPARYRRRQPNPIRKGPHTLKLRGYWVLNGFTVDINNYLYYLIVKPNILIQLYAFLQKKKKTVLDN